MAEKKSLAFTDVVAIDVDLVEEFDGYSVIASLAEMHAVFEVSSAEMQSDGHILWTSFDAFIVCPNVRVQQGFMVDSLLFHPGQCFRIVVSKSLEFLPSDHRGRAEISQQRIVELDIAASESIKVLYFLLVRQCNIRKVFVCNDPFIRINFQK